MLTSQKESPTLLRRLRAPIVVAIVVVAVLELTVVVFGLGVKRPFLPYDLTFLITSFLLVTSTDIWQREKPFIVFRPFPGRPVAHNIIIFIFLYALLVKLSFFAGYFAHMIVDAVN